MRIFSGVLPEFFQYFGYKFRKYFFPNDCFRKLKKIELNIEFVKTFAKNR